MIYQAQFKKEQQEFVARKLDTVGWTKYLSISVLWWLAFGLIYQSIGANRPYRDSITDATNGVGQLLMTVVYREQWIFLGCYQCFLYLFVVGRKPSNSREIHHLSYQQSSWLVPMEQGSKESLILMFIN